MASLQINKLVFLLSLVLVVLHSLAAYNLGPVPFPWLAQVGFIGLFLIVLARAGTWHFPGLNLFIAVFLWSALVTGVNLITEGVEAPLLAHATTGYWAYVSLRFVNLIFFASALSVFYWLLDDGFQNRVVKALVNIGVVISLIGIYCYFAQLYGLPEPARNRMATDGGQQTAVFSYAFHRVVSTFREPSHFAAWLILPLCLSFYIEQRFLNFKTALMMLSLLMTGSLTGIVGFVLGTLVALTATLRFDANRIRYLLQVVAIVAVGTMAFSMIVPGDKNSGEKVELMDILWGRLLPIFESGGGMKKTDRNYIYEYVEGVAFPVFGEGVGRANLKLSEAIGGQTTTSFLSLYLNEIYSTGILGLALVMLFMAFPLWLFYHSGVWRGDSKAVYVLGSYIAWLVMFAVDSEEFTLSFAINFALLVYLSQNGEVNAR